MDNTTHPLLVPRWKVIQDYPGCPYEIGTILMADESGELYSPIAGYSQSAVKIMEKESHKFKHLAEPLPWYAERTESDMPEYIRFKQDNTVYKIQKWDMNRLFGFIDIENRKGCGLTTFKPEYGYEPSTLEEYNAYLSSKEAREGEKKEGL